MATSEKNLPTHIGFIVDGNRRWAKERNLPTLAGHTKGFEIVEDVAIEAVNRGVKFVSFYLFSTENWNRTEAEVSYLMDLVRKNIVRLTKKLKKENIRVALFGRQERVPEDIWEAIKKSEEETKDGTKGTVGICFNYGGHHEIADAVTKIIAERAANPSAFDDAVTPEDIERHLYYPDAPACDLIIRTSGEQRLSGFMLWRAAYSELMFYDKYFPDLDPKKDLDVFLAEYASRHRRFGK